MGVAGEGNGGRWRASQMASGHARVREHDDAGCSGALRGAQLGVQRGRGVRGSQAGVSVRPGIVHHGSQGLL